MKTICTAILLSQLTFPVFAQNTKSCCTLTLNAYDCRTEIVSGNPIVVGIALHNNSNHEIPNSRTTDPLEHYFFTVVAPDGTPAAKTAKLLARERPADPADLSRRFEDFRFGSLGSKQSDGEVIVLSDYYDMSKPGKYVIQCEGRYDTVSNKLELVVLNKDRSTK